MGSYVNKRGQMKLSFGMIFSIILIIIFVSFAFFAIKKFLEIGDSAQVAKFADSVQKDIDRAWKGSQSSQEREYFLPSKIKFVCFANYSDYPLGAVNDQKKIYEELRKVFQEYENLFFYPAGASEGLNSKQIKHIDLIKTTSDNNPFCIENKEGKIKLTFEKLYRNTLVTIK